MILFQPNRITLALAARELLSVTADAVSSGTAYRLGDKPGEASRGTTAIEAGETVSLGPFTESARFELVCAAGFLTYSTAPADLTALDLTGGSIEYAKSRTGAGSYQPIAVDLELAADAGTSDQGDTDFLAPIMGNVLGDGLTKTHNYLGGLIGADSITDTKSTDLQKGAILAVVMDGVTEADGAVVAVIDGGDPSSVTRVNAAFAARQNNNNAGSGVDYGLDLYDAGRDETLYSGGGEPLTIAKAVVRLPSQACIMEGAGPPVDGTTGDNFAAKGSLYIDNTTPGLYINTGTITDSVWIEFAQAP